ncbi:MAG: DUF1360 domain-containing protein [Solirubrobacteraceae bacterium]
MTVASLRDESLKDGAESGGYSPDHDRPLGGYLVLMSVYATGCTAFVRWIRRSHRQLPAQVGTRDLVLLSIATHKAARLAAKDRVASTLRAPFTRYEADAGPGEVTEEARGRGLRRAVGELVTCPSCIGMWIATGFVGALAVAPRPTRWTASILTVLTGADALQIGYARAERLL